MLLVEIIEYDRRVDNWKNGQNVSESILRCRMRGRLGKGYNYGPGTPTFIGEAKHEPLEPIKAFNQYKKLHSLGAVKEELMGKVVSSNRSFAIGHVPCHLNDLDDQVHALLNGKCFIQSLVPK
jgi:hypothetical protein